jgi:hypothetical protein
MKNPLILIPTCSWLTAGALLAAASGFSCQPAEAKSPNEAGSGGSNSANVTPRRLQIHTQWTSMRLTLGPTPGSL